MTATMASMSTRRASTTLDPLLSECATILEVAESIGITDQAFYNLRDRHESFPMPIRFFGKTAVYLREELEAFHREVGRGYGRIEGQGGVVYPESGVRG